MDTSIRGAVVFIYFMRRGISMKKLQTTLFALMMMTLSLAGCTDLSEQIDLDNDGMDVDELYYFSSYFAFDLEIRNGNNVTLENHRLVACDGKPYVGCIDEDFSGNEMNFEVPLNSTKEIGIWIDTNTYSSPIFAMYETTERNVGYIFTDQGLGITMFNINFNQTKADEWNVTDANGDGELQVCNIGLSEELLEYHTLFIDEINDNSTVEEQNHAAYQRFLGYISLLEDKNLIGLFNDYCEVEYLVHFLVIDTSTVE